MKFDIKANLVETTTISNGMGGYKTGTKIVSEIYVFTTPVKAELMLREYGIVTTTSLKVFTKDVVSDEHYKLTFNGKSYKQLQLADFGKIRMMLVEEVEANG